MAAVGFVIFNTGKPISKANNSKITVTDMEGRMVTMNYPVERIIMTESSRTTELSAIYGDGFEDKIVGWDDDFKNFAGDGYQCYVKKYPMMADVPDVGSVEDGTFSVEKVILLKPDVVIMHNWMYSYNEESTKDVVSKLDRAGIPVLFVDFYLDPMNNTTKSMLLFGKIMGKEQRAQEIVSFYNSRTNAVYSRLANIQGNKPDVYIEVGIKGPSDYGDSFGNIAWGSMIPKAGGNNIAEPLLGNKDEPISPEYIVDHNPDVIILTGRNWSMPGSLRLGYTTSADVAKNTMAPFLQRPGWNTLDAVKNHRVYGIYHGYCLSIYNFVALEAMAKWFYPEEFKDVDPNATLKEFHEKFMPVEYTGTFLYSYY
ncbi:MAG TPA: ABC transporter substrate-binding protein [Methanosarcina sp.]|nr:ABC transporter substrate-binding protein [Methanosarcina sp.]